MQSLKFPESFGFIFVECDCVCVLYCVVTLLFLAKKVHKADYWVIMLLNRLS